MSERHIIQFVSALDVVGSHIDRDKGIIKGVSLITGGVMAKGHNLHVDDTTLTQLLSEANRLGQVPVKENHKGGAGEVTGYITNFRRDGNKIKGDWYLLQTYPRYHQFLETAERMPRGVGLSVSFVGPDKPEIGKDGRAKARCKELVSCDYVTMPAANPDGLFQDGSVDSSKPRSMSGQNSTTDLDTILSAIQGLTTRLEKSEKRLNFAINPPPIEDLAAMSEAQLAEIGLTPADVQEALEALQQQGEGEEGNDEGASIEDLRELAKMSPAQAKLLGIDLDAVKADLHAAEAEAAENGEGDPANRGQANPGQGGDAAAAASAGGAPAGGGAALQRVESVITNFERRIQSMQDEQERVQFEAFVTELGEKVEALAVENDALRHALHAMGSVQTIKPTRDTLGFQRGERPDGSFENLVEMSVEAAIEKNPKLNRRQAKVIAFQSVRTENPEAYSDYLKRIGVSK